MAKSKNKIEQPLKQEKRSAGSKAEQIKKLLQRKNGASIEELQKATGWQAHSLHGFLSILRKRGSKIERLSVDGEKSTYLLSNNA